MLRLFLALALFTSVTTAFSKPMVCTSLAKAIANAKQRGESPQLSGVMGQGWRFVVFASEHGETWTTVHVQPNRVACVVASGKNLKVLWPDDKL